MTGEVETWWTTLARLPAVDTTTGEPDMWREQGTAESFDSAKNAARAAIDDGSKLEYGIAYVRREVVGIIRRGA